MIVEVMGRHAGWIALYAGLAGGADVILIPEIPFSLETIVDKIDPGLLADIVIKATALQEKSNASLRAKGSPYRISEIVITATIPPQVSFSIGRVGEVEEELTGREISSTQIAAQEGLHDDVVISLDGTTVSTDELAQAEMELAAEESAAAS